MIINEPSLSPENYSCETQKKSRSEKNNLNHTKGGTSPLFPCLVTISTFQVRGNWKSTSQTEPAVVRSFITKLEKKMFTLPIP